MFGLGGIGLNVIQGLRMVGADNIVGVDINPEKKAWGERFGMTHFVNPIDPMITHTLPLARINEAFAFELMRGGRGILNAY